MASRKKAAGSAKKKSPARARVAKKSAAPRRRARARAASPRRPAPRRKVTARTRPRGASARRPTGRTAATRRTPRTARPGRATPRSSATPSPMTLPAPNGRTVGTGIGLTHHHMDFSTHDLEGMRRFFTETLGFTNVLHIPEANYMTVFVTPTSSLGFMPPASAPEQWQPPGEPNLYFFVADVDAVFARLSAEGVSFDQAPTDMPWGHRLAILRDPEGRRVCLAQNLKR